MTRESAAIGSIVGLAVGDALGYPHEFRSVAQVRRELGPEGITGFIRCKDERFTRPIIIGRDHPAGTFTDDTQMTIAVAEGLIAKGRASRDLLMGELGRRFVEWYFGPENNRAPGEATGVGCTNLRDGAPWRTAGKEGSKGCGANMRVAPIGLYFDDLDLLADIARDQALLTHRHAAAAAGSAAAALLVALARRGASPKAAHAEVAKRCAGKSPDFDAVFSRLPSAVSREPGEVLVALDASPHALGEGWIAEEAVACALYCWWRHPRDFRACVLEAANTDGDSDSIACIAGGIAGAGVGIEGIPADWVREVEKSSMLHDLGRRLARAAASGGPPSTG